MTEKQNKISLLMTGDEILSGDIIDSNSQYLCKELSSIGFEPCTIVKVGDKVNKIIEAIDFLSKQSGIILINGGLGPTDDDLTVDAISKYFERKIVLNPIAHQHLIKICASNGYDLNPVNLKQAFLPEDSQTIDNIGSCMGLVLKKKGLTVISTPGVPNEMKYMWNNTIREYIKAEFAQEDKTITQGFRLFGLGESTIQEMINKSGMKSDCLHFGFRVSMPYVDVKITGTHLQLEQINQINQQLANLFNEFIIGELNESLPCNLVNMLASDGKTLAISESCTGGLISSLVTDVPGASECFKGGYVTYHNDMKISELSVDANIISKFGTVSEETAYQMVKGTLAKSQSDFALSSTGIAGPKNISSTKKIGTVFIGFGQRDDIHVLPMLLKGNRIKIRHTSSYVALDLLRRYISGKSLSPKYSFLKSTNS